MSDLLLRREHGLAALAYLRRNWVPIPLCWPTSDGRCGCGRDHIEKNVGKAPLVAWEQFVTHVPTEVTVRSWWHTWPLANIGVLLEPSRLLVVDADSERAMHEAQEHGLPSGPTAMSGKGEHRYFLAPNGFAGRTTKRGEARALDVLASGYAVVPPSLHRTQQPYTWRRSPGDAPLQDAPAWAVKMLTERPAVAAQAVDLPHGLPRVEVATLAVPERIRRLISEGWKADPDHYPTRSEAVFAVTQALVKARYDDTTIAAVLLDPRHRISEKPRQQGRRWVAGEIGRARVKACDAPSDTSGKVGQTTVPETSDPPSPSPKRPFPKRRTPRHVRFIEVVIA